MSRLRVLLVSGNRETLPDPVAPLGLAWIAAVLRQAGHEVAIDDLCFQSDPEAAAERAARAFRPDVIGLSVRNADNVTAQAPAAYAGELARLAAALRRGWPAPLLLGGSGFSLLPGPLLAALGADAGIAGEGEGSVRAAIEALAAGRTPEEVPGIVLPGSSRPPAAVDLAGLPEPARDLLDNRRYLALGGSGNVQTKRGCAAGCIYCTYPLIQGRTLRLRDPERVAAELAGARAAYGIDHFYVVDNVFTDPPEHALAVAGALSGLDPRPGWSCYGNPRGLDGELAGAMAAAGCTGVDMGIDVAEPGMLRRLGKGFSQAEILTAAAACRRAGLPFCFSLLLGGPGETEATARETLAVCEAADPDAVVLMVGLRIYPGTALAEMALAEGRIAPGDDLLQPRFYVAEEFGPTAQAAVFAHARGRINWVIPGQGYNLDHRIQKKIRGYGFRGPLWEYSVRLRSARGWRRPEPGPGRSGPGGAG